MATVTEASIRSTTWNNVKEVIDNYTFSTAFSKVTSAFPDGDVSFPLLVIHPIQVSKGTFSLGDRSNSTSNKSIVVSIDLYTTRADTLDALSDNLLDALTTNLDGMFLVESDEDALGQFELVKGQKVHAKSFSLSYSRRA